MARESNPDHPGVDGVWFRVRKDGNFVDVPPVAREKNDPTVGWMPLSSFPGDSTTASDLINGIQEVSHGDTYENLSLDESSTEPVDDGNSVDLDQYGLTKDDAIVFGAKGDDDDDKDKNENNGNENGNDGNNDNGNNDDNGNDDNENNGNDDNGNNGDDDGNNGDNNDNNDNKGDDDDDDGRDYPNSHPTTKGYWFVVQDENGDDIDVSAAARAIGSPDNCLGWNPIPNDSSLPTDHVVSGRIKKKICQGLDLDPQDYKLYGSQRDDADDVFDDNYVADLGSIGLKKNDPLLVKYEPGNNDKSDSGSDGGDDHDQENNQGNNSENVDKWANYRIQIQNITNGDWSLYPDTIRDLQPGEILWTDGNSSYCYASAPTIQAYSVVRRYPNQYDGQVIQNGLVSAIVFEVPIILGC